MSAHFVSETIRSLYETYPYPSRIPGGTADPFLEYIWAFGGQPHSRQRSFLDAGCGTGLNVLGGAILYPQFEVYGCDLNRVSLEQLKKEASSLSLSNLHLKEMDLLNLDSSFGPTEGFDIMYSTGVIHHTADPVGVLKSLSSRLAPQGILRLMVYGELGRSDLYRFARVAKTLYHTPDNDWQTRVRKSRELMRELEITGSQHGNYPPPVFRGPWEDAKRIDDIEFADRYLNPHDRPFTIPTLRTAVEQSGLELLKWFEPREWELATLLPQFAQSGLLPDDPWKRFAVVEELFDRPRLDLYLVKPGFVRRQLVFKAHHYLGLNPQLFLTCTKVRGLSFHRTAQLRLGKEEILTRDEGILLEAFGLRFITLADLLPELPNPTLEHWTPIVEGLLQRDLLFCPHPFRG